MSHAFLIVEDHPLTRAGTRELLSSAFPGCLCEEASSRQSARRALASRTWSLVVLDIDMPDGSGLELLPCASPTLVLTMHADPARREEALCAGASGFASKAESPERILAAIRSILGIDRLRPQVSEAPRPVLSERERLVFEALMAGRRLVDVAAEAGLSATTVQSYKNRLFHKLGVDSLAELARLAATRRVR